MAATEELRAVFTAEDRTSSVLRAIGAQLRGLSGSSGIGRLVQAGGQLLGTVGGLSRGIATMALSVAGLSGAASAAGLTTLAVSASSTGAQLKALAEASGVPIAQLEILADMSRRASVSQDDLSGGLGTLNERMRSAARGGNAELRQVMARLGISLRDSSGQVRNAADVLPAFANAFQRVRDPALRAEFATALFGDAGSRLLPILTGGAEGLREGERQFRRYGVSVADSVDELSQANSQFEDLKNSMLGFASSITTAIGTQLAPILGPIASDMARWAQENRGWIATGIARSIREAAEAVRAFFADRGPIERLRDLRDSAANVVESLGGLRAIMIGFAALVAAPFVASLISVVSNIALVIGIVARLGLALLATPVGWFIGIVAALGFAAYKLWESWEPVSAWFLGLWTRMRDAWAPQVSLLVDLVTGLGGVLISPLIAAWEPVRDFFSGLWDGIVGVFTGAWESIRPIVEAVTSAASRILGGSGGEESSNPAMNAPAQADRRRRFGARANRFDDDENPVDADRVPQSPSRPATRSALPQSPWQSAARPTLPPSPLGSSPESGRAANGSIEATIRFENAPPGTRVEATSTGVVERPRTDVGINLRGSR
nr:hypothetical protein [uncultured Roseococcus sp.]